MTLAQAIDPLTPPDCDLRSFREMHVDVVLLRDSSMASSDDPEVFRAAVLLWCASWHQLPAASLPNNDKELAKLAGFGRAIDAWLGVKEAALHKFSLATDGRLYHPVVASFALKAWDKKKKRIEAGRLGGSVKRQLKRRPSVAKANASHGTERNGTEVLAPTPNGAGVGASPSPRLPPAQGMRIDPAWFADEIDRAYAAEKGLSKPDVDGQEDAFRDYWTARAGQNGRKLDWHATWRTWVRRYLEDRKDGRTKAQLAGDARRENLGRAFTAPDLSAGRGRQRGD